MRVLILHNRYQQPGGEDAVVRAEAMLLRQNGLEVEVFEVDNLRISGLNGKARAFLDIADSTESAELLKRRVSSFSPDVLHIHNFFPLLSPSVHRVGRQMGLAVVQTLHNYRAICAAATFYRDGEVCESCLNGSKFNALFHRCYKNSALGTISLLRFQRAFREKWFDVDRFVALTQFSKEKFISGGFPSDRLVVKPNFVYDTSSLPLNNPRQGALYVGRLSEEKGVTFLVEAWKLLPQLKLTIVGDGPERAFLQKNASPNVRFAGRLDTEQINELMRRSRFLIVPSKWYEGFPMVIAEAYSNGLPVIASDIGSLSEIITPKSGFLFDIGNADSFCRVVSKAFSIGEYGNTMGSSARALYEELYSPSRNYERLRSIYNEAILFKESRSKFAPGFPPTIGA